MPVFLYFLIELLFSSGVPISSAPDKESFKIHNLTPTLGEGGRKGYRLPTSALTSAQMFYLTLQSRLFSVLLFFDPLYVYCWRMWGNSGRPSLILD